METEGCFRLPTLVINKSCHSSKFIICFIMVSLIAILLYIQVFPSDHAFLSSSSASCAFFPRKINYSDVIETVLTAKLRDSVTFLPLKDLRSVETATTGNTWFMSSLNDTYEDHEAQYMYFPSDESKGRLLCIKGRDIFDGTKNSYSLAWQESLPSSATLLEGMTFVSNTYYDYQNLWHGLCAMTPFVRWAMKNGCIKPTRWVLFHWGELRFKMGSWLEQLLEANFGDVRVEGFDRGEGPYCFKKAVVMRHDMGAMSQDNILKVYDLLRCRARNFCGLKPKVGREVSERGLPTIRLTLLMRRGSRSFKNATAATDIFAKECARVEGCMLKVEQSEALSFCDQVKMMTYTDIVASPHGAQLTNMLFMDRESSVMEFFPKGWLEHAGIGQYVYHWMANQSGMKHQGAWWDPIGEECPFPKNDLECFLFHKDGKVGQNEAYFAEWTRRVLEQVRVSKQQQANKALTAKRQLNSEACHC